MKIAFVNDALIVCGGLITNYEYCQKLREKGYDAFIVANGDNAELSRRYPTVPILRMDILKIFTDEDVIIANWWPQCQMLEVFKGRKIQFVQGNDTKADYGDDFKKLVMETRNNPKWELLGVSKYALEWTGRQGKVIPNGISDMFFEDYGMERDIDALIEGNNERVKNIDYAVEQAKKDGHKRIVWLGRETRPIEGVETITNPPFEEIPKIYQRAKHFYKYSLSEGFCLPIVEAKASGCQIHTWDQGHNFPEDFDPKEYTWEKASNKLIEYLNEPR